jgi:hypothetical protein
MNFSTVRQSGSQLKYISAPESFNLVSSTCACGDSVLSSTSRCNRHCRGIITSIVLQVGRLVVKKMDQILSKSCRW